MTGPDSPGGWELPPLFVLMAIAVGLLMVLAGVVDVFTRHPGRGVVGVVCGLVIDGLYGRIYARQGGTE